MKKTLLLTVFVCLCIGATAQNSPQQNQKMQDTTMKQRNPPRHRNADKDKKSDTTKLNKEKNEGNVKPTPDK